MRRSMTRALLVGLTVTGSVAVAHGGGPSFRTVALTGQSAPGTSDQFNYFTYGVVDGVNGAAVYAVVTGPQTADFCFGIGDPLPEQGIWSEVTGSLSLLARRGGHAPGMDPDVVFESFDAPVLNDSGNTAFQGFLVGTDLQGECVDGTSGIWADTAGALSLVAASGTPAPGTSAGVLFNNFSNLHFNGHGRTAFSGFVTGDGVDTTNGRGVWVEDGGGLVLAGRSGSQAPDTAPGVVFDWFGSGSPVLNDSGDIAYRAALLGPGVIPSNSYGIWSGPPEALALVARGGDPAPGVAGATFLWLGAPMLNAAGQTAFSATVTGPGVTGDNELGIWSEGSGALQLVARTGDAAPGAGGAVFTNFTNVVLSGGGATAFRGFLGTGSAGIWSDASGALDLVARLGDAAPGTAPGVAFAGFAGPAINAAGRTAFWAVVSGAGISADNDAGIWAMGTDGVLAAVAREGDVLAVAPGDDRTIAGLNMITGNRENGGATGFNDDGRLALQMYFTDGSSGVFVVSMCPSADLDGDCAVGFGDVLAIIAAWGPCPTACPADLNGDGVVSFADILEAIADWD